MVGSQMADGQAHLVVGETCLRATVILAALLFKGLPPSLTEWCIAWAVQRGWLVTCFLSLSLSSLFSLPLIFLGLAPFCSLQCQIFIHHKLRKRLKEPNQEKTLGLGSAYVVREEGFAIES